MIVGLVNKVVGCEGELTKFGSIPMIESKIKSRQNEIGNLFTLWQNQVFILIQHFLVLVSRIFFFCVFFFFFCTLETCHT